MLNATNLVRAPVVVIDIRRSPWLHSHSTVIDVSDAIIVTKGELITIRVMERARETNLSTELLRMVECMTESAEVPSRTHFRGCLDEWCPPFI